MTDPLHISPRDQIKIREGWLARRSTTKAVPSTMCLAKHTHNGAYWQVMCSCSRDPGHAADYHEDASVPVRWPVEAVSPVAAAPPVDREWLLARLVGCGNERTDDALRAGLTFAETLPSRSLDPRRLPRDEPHPRPSLPHHAALAGEVVGEVARAERKHGRAMPGGFGLAGRPIDHTLMLRAKSTCDAARDGGEVSWRHVLQEEVAEVFAERGGSMLQRAELVQVAAVCLRWIEAIDSLACAVGFMVWLRGVTVGEVQGG